MSDCGGPSWWAVDAVFAPDCGNLEPLPGGVSLCLAQLTASSPGSHLNAVLPKLHLDLSKGIDCTVSQGQCELKDIARSQSASWGTGGWSACRESLPVTEGETPSIADSTCV